MTAGDGPHIVEAMGADTSSRSEIIALDDDNLLAFWLKASKEYDRLVWSESEDFRRKGSLVERRVAWSQTEIDNRLREPADPYPDTGRRRMSRYEIILPESGCRLTAVADSAEQVAALEQLGWPCRRVGATEHEGRSEPARRMT